MGMIDPDILLAYSLIEEEFGFELTRSEKAAFKMYITSYFEHEDKDSSNITYFEAIDRFLLDYFGLDRRELVKERVVHWDPPIKIPGMACFPQMSLKNIAGVTSICGVRKGLSHEKAE